MFHMKPNTDALLPLGAAAGALGGSDLSRIRSVRLCIFSLVFISYRQGFVNILYGLFNSVIFFVALHSQAASIHI